MRKSMILLVAAIAMGSAGTAFAANPEPGSRPTREFVQTAAQSDAFEVLEAETVLAASTNPQVHAFAQQMIHDHGETTQALTQATERSGLKPPPKGISGDQAALLGALQGLRGPALDREYLRQQVIMHSGALAVEQAYASNGDDPAVRGAAAAATPMISGHLAMAEQMRASLGGS